MTRRPRDPKTGRFTKTLPFGPGHLDAVVKIWEQQPSKFREELLDMLEGVGHFYLRRIAKIRAAFVEGDDNQEQEKGAGSPGTTINPPTPSKANPRRNPRPRRRLRTRTRRK